jgi:Ni/Fe-hydrogenase subunit HybB-like protein
MATISHPTHVAATPRFTLGRAVLWILAVMGVAIIAMRLMYGIGGISNMSNPVPWGFWIGHKLTGVFTGGAAFTLCAAIYIFGKEQFHKLIRPAVLTGLLCYIMFIVLLLFDLGRPERIWHLIIYWNIHSPLFEVGWCVMIYTTVLLFEFLPVVFERFAWTKAIHAMHKITLPLMILGVLLSTLHQSSLGSLMLAEYGKVHPLWYTGFIPPFFFVTAISGGISFLILEEWLRCHYYDQPFELGLLSKLAKVVPWVLALFLSARLIDVYVGGELGLLFTSGKYSWMWWSDLIIGTVIPMVLFFIPSVRNSRKGLITASMFVCLGTMLYRFNVSLTGWIRPEGTVYTPHWMELGMSVGVVAMMILVYDFIVRNFPVFATSEH